MFRCAHGHSMDAGAIWRPAGTVIAVILALLVTWHVIYGKHGISVWQQKRAEDRAIAAADKDVQQENAEMRQQYRAAQVGSRRH